MKSDPLRWKCRGGGCLIVLGIICLEMGLKVNLVEMKWMSSLINLSLDH